MKGFLCVIGVFAVLTGGFKLKKKINAVFFCIFSLFSCGIDNIIYLAPPSSKHDPSDNIADNEKYFEFETSDTENTANASGYFNGFDIFYKIYENENECNSDIVRAVTHKENNWSDSVNYLRSTLGFFLLKCSTSSSQPLIPSASANRSIHFRLIAYSSDSAEIKIDGSPYGAVLRNNGNDFTAIEKTDFDVKPSRSPTDPNTLYVAVFTAAYGMDTAFKPFYSEVVKLGYVKIPKPSSW